MQLFAHCSVCSSDPENSRHRCFFVPYYEDRLCFINCEKGHRSAIILQRQKFEILMESGTNALIAGFTLEAVGGFAAALERFYEFSVRVLFHSKNVPWATYEAMFRGMARQSERQLGAFMAVHALILHRPYSQDTNIAKFRNSVIHKGEIPTPEQAESFCALIYDEVRNLTLTLQAACRESLQAVVMRDISERKTVIPKDVQTWTGGQSTIFSVFYDPIPQSFAEAKQLHSMVLKAQHDIVQNSH